MQIGLVADEGRLVCLGCQGQIRKEDPSDPFEALLGADCYSRRVILDLGRTTFIDSSGIGWLVVSHRRFRNAGGALILHSVPGPVLDALRFVRSHSFLTIAGNESDARALAFPGEAEN